MQRGDGLPDGRGGRARVGELVADGADPDAVGTDFITMLSRAGRREHLQTANWLREHQIPLVPSAEGYR